MTLLHKGNLVGDGVVKPGIFFIFLFFLFIYHNIKYARNI